MTTANERNGKRQSHCKGVALFRILFFAGGIALTLFPSILPSLAAERASPETQCPIGRSIYLELDALKESNIIDPGNIKPVGLTAFRGYLSDRSKRKGLKFALLFKNCIAAVMYGDVELESVRIGALFPLSYVGRADDFVVINTQIYKIQKAESQKTSLQGRLEIRIR